ncbi:MAG: hypothetical protein JST51_01455 [Armatimonadetes bacterium]|nr:hypothetical protein [Armatimonadota bacterium]
MMDKLSILVNTAQKRVSTERVGITAGGTDFDANSSLSSSVWMDPIVGGTFIKPYCLTDTWHTDGTGVYARLGLSDFGLSGDWTTKGDKSAGQTRMYLQGGGMSSSAISSSSYGKNRGFFFSFFNFGIGNDDRAVSAECGYGNSGVATSGVGLRWRDSGRVEVWKDGVLDGEYNMGLVTGQQTTNKYNDILIMPMRRRELLVVNLTNGTGFVHVFTSITEDESDPTITPNESFWFYFPNSRGVDVEIAPLLFPASAYVVSKTYNFGKIPVTGQTLETWANSSPASSITNAKVYAEAATGSSDEAVSSVAIIKDDGSGSFTPDSTTDKCRVKVTMTSSTGGTYTPFLSGVHAAYAAVFSDTDDSEMVDISDKLLSAHLTVGDDPAGVELDCDVRDPKGLEESISGLLTVENMPCQVKLGTLVIIDGTLMPVKFTDGIDGEVQVGELKIRDRTESMQRLTHRDRVPIDGWDLCKPSSSFSLVRYLYQKIGIQNSEMDLDDVDFAIPDVPGAKAGDWGNLIATDNTPFSKLSEVVDEFASGFYWGFWPTVDGPKAVFKDPAGLSSTPDVKIYRSAEDAIADGVAEADAPQLTYDNYYEEPLPIEGNELRITGLDPRYNDPRPIVAWSEDTASKDPTTAPSSRPDNWVGEPRVVAFASPRLRTDAACQRLVGQAFSEISARRYLAGFDSQCLLDVDGVPIWVGSLVDVDGQRELRISSLQMDFQIERDDLVFRHASYIGGARLGLGGSTIKEIKAMHRLRLEHPTLSLQKTKELAGTLVSLSTKV